jgi:hypothetical protein
MWQERNRSEGDCPKRAGIPSTNITLFRRPGEWVAASYGRRGVRIRDGCHRKCAKSVLLVRSMRRERFDGLPNWYVRPAQDADVWPRDLQQVPQIHVFMMDLFSVWLFLEECSMVRRKGPPCFTDRRKRQLSMMRCWDAGACVRSGEGVVCDGVESGEGVRMRAWEQKAQARSGEPWKALMLLAMPSHSLPRTLRRAERPAGRPGWGE